MCPILVPQTMPLNWVLLYLLFSTSLLGVVATIHFLATNMNE